LIEHPQREVFVGSAGRMLTAMHAAAPGMAEQTFAGQVDKGHLSQEQDAAPSSGNLFEPAAYGTTASGGWKDEK
jgi:hypothetical protein